VAYAQSKDVRQVRLVYCDAQPYDDGYIAIDDLLGRVKVKGRGGTVLQPAVNLVEGLKDFPRDAPILIITDGWIDTLSIKRIHAYLLPKGQRLPFKTAGEVFYVE
jgi:predicted metal-dependent peptidase